ncbi:MAG TPA: hypothetical protein VHA75_10150, partial [Rugosimonospora sp.]|nr:hypothetical protein [Rugosimonospora sp.]
MVTCPRGHSSTATDYCDECGAPIGGGTPGADSAAAATPPTSAPPTSASPVSAAGSGEPCPDCDTPRTGRFCELCGYDFVAAASAGGGPAGGSGGGS